MGLERRVSQDLKVEIRGGAEKKSFIDGYASVANVSTVIWYFEEVIAPGAFSRALDELSQGKQDVRSLFNHDANYVLGRTARGGNPGTLILREDSKGLWTETEPPEQGKSPIADSVVESIRRGDVSGMSFAFTVKKQEWEFFDDPTMEKLDRRTITEIGVLYDIGPVTYPAYDQTSVGLRMKVEAKREHDEARGRWQERRGSTIVVPKEFEHSLREMRSADEAWVNNDPVVAEEVPAVKLEATNNEETKEPVIADEAAKIESETPKGDEASVEAVNDGTGEVTPEAEPVAVELEQVSSDVSAESEARSRQIALKRKVREASRETRACVTLKFG